MAGNTVYVQGSYVDIHDNEVVNLAIDKATVHLQNEEVAETKASLDDWEETTEEDELNYFAPKKNITVLVCLDWFDEFSMDKTKYTEDWREQLIEELMDSEYGTDIALQWEDSKKQIQVKCAFVGALVDVGVIKGSYNALAPHLGIQRVAVASLAKYMGYGKKQPYFEWLKEYVKE